MTSPHSQELSDDIKKSSTASRPSKRTTKDSAENSDSTRTKEGESASSIMSRLIGDVVGDSLSESVSNLKSKVSEQVSIHGREYLDTVRDRIIDATSQVAAWGKKNPVKTVAAAAALIAVSDFLYSTLHGKTGRDESENESKRKSKMKAASGRG